MPNPPCVAIVKRFEDKVVRCGEPGQLYAICKEGGCEEKAWACGEQHYPQAENTMNGHALRRHPDKYPDAVRALKASPEALAQVRQLAEQFPREYDRLLDALERA